MTGGVTEKQTEIVRVYRLVCLCIMCMHLRRKGAKESERERRWMGGQVMHAITLTRFIIR